VPPFASAELNQIAAAGDQPYVGWQNWCRGRGNEIIHNCCVSCRRGRWRSLRIASKRGDAQLPGGFAQRHRAGWKNRKVSKARFEDQTSKHPSKEENRASPTQERNSAVKTNGSSQPQSPVFVVLC
jgi:hypothetical protein